MKIAYLLNSVSRKAGGVFEICKRLAQTTCGEKEIVVLGVEDEFTKTDFIEWAPLRPTVFSPVFARSFGYAPGYAQCLAAASPDIAHVHGLWMYPSLEDAAHRSAACFHVNSEAEHLMLRQHGLRNPICIVPNGIDLPASQSSEVSSLVSGLASIARGRKLLLYLGRLHPKKNLVNLIRAWKEALNSHLSTLNPWMLAIAGWDQGGHEAQLRQLTTDLRLLTSVMFLGPQFGADKEACYRACDALVLPSLSEGLPMTVLEAWAYAKPVLMTPECNLPEGFAADAALRICTTSNAIAAGLKQLIEMSDDDRKAMGTRGRVLVVEKFSWPRIGEQMRSVYEWVLGGGKVPETLRLSDTRART